MEHIKADFHIHTKYSIEPRALGLLQSRPWYGPERVIQTVIKKGLDAIAITDHDTMKGANIGAKILKKKYIANELILVKGEEISTSDGHLIGLGIEEEIKPDLSAEETIDQIKSQGGVAIAPHPFAFHGLKNLIPSLKLDGVELFGPWNGFFPNKEGVIMLKGLKLSKMGSSDAHTLGVIGKIRTKLNVKHSSIDCILESIKKGNVEPEYLMNEMDHAVNLLKCFGLSFLFFRRASW
jgi:hypothetical protein